MQIIVYSALYSPSLTQKRKKWFDGKLKFRNGQLKLLDEEGRVIASRRVKDTPSAGDSLYFERFIVEVYEVIEQSTEEVKSTISEKSPIVDANSRPLNLKRPNSLGPPLELLLKREGLWRTMPPKHLKVSSSGMQSESPEHVEEKRIQEPLSVPNETPVIQPNEAQPPLIEPHNEAPDEDLFLPFDSPPGSPDEDELPLFEPHTSTPLQPTLKLSPDSLDCHHDVSLPLENFELTLTDLESDVEITDEQQVNKVSPFEGMPGNLSNSGPWTKEAYLLFTWHPPVVKKEL